MGNRWLEEQAEANRKRSRRYWIIDNGSWKRVGEREYREHAGIPPEWLDFERKKGEVYSAPPFW